MPSKFVPGWSRDVPDVRDAKFAFSAPRTVLKALPPKADLRLKCPPVLDQGDLGSCTANAVGNLDLFMQRKQKLPETFQGSRLFLYYNARFLEGTNQYDAGAQLRTVLKTLGKQGVCPETEWPYNVERFTERPVTKCYTHARQHTPISYHSIPQNLSSLKACLSMGQPFVFGFMVYTNFMSDEVARSGVANMPFPGEDLLGGHAVMAVGYEDATKRFIIMNSWGAGWGSRGYFSLPYAYVIDPRLAADFWTIDVAR